MSHDVIVLGDCNPDLVLTGDVTPAFGETEKIVETADLTIGGSGSILAAGIARLGLRAALVAVLGDDPLGRVQLEALRERDVDLGAVVTDPRRSTGVTVVLSRGADRAILTSIGSIDALAVDMIDRDALFAARHLHVSSFFLQRRLWPGLPALLRSAREAGITTSLDTNWDPEGAWGQALIDVLPLVDVFLPNLAEAQRITGERDAGAAADGLAQTVGTVALKLGARGAIARADGQRADATAPEVEVVDTTGAGDSFGAGFLTGWLADWPLERSLRLACACGALSTRARGGTTSQPTLDEALTAAGLG